MPQALESLCLIHFWNWDISPFLLLALWGINNWPPTKKVKPMGRIRLQKKELVWFGCFYTFLLPQTMLPSKDQIAHQQGETN